MMAARRCFEWIAWGVMQQVQVHMMFGKQMMPSPEILVVTYCIFNVRSKPFDATSNPMSAGHCMASHTAESSQPGIAQGESESSLSVADRSKG